MSFSKVFLLLLVILMNACVSPDPFPGDFVETTDFHLIQSFRIAEITLSGMPWDANSAKILKQYSEKTLRASMVKKGFQENLNIADCLVRATWHKRLRVHSKTTEPFLDTSDTSRRYENNNRPLAWIGLTIEFYNPKTDKIFWRASMHDQLKIINLNETAIVEILEDAIVNFPKCVEFNPQLKNFK